MCPPRLATLTVTLLALASAASAQLPARWPRAPLTEVARAQIGADAAFERFGLTGRRSTLCLIDTGIDEAIDPARVHAIWDADGAPRGHEVESSIGGAVYTLDAVSDAPPDRHGHGTAMASIALGARGIAPLATLIVAAVWDRTLAGFPDDDVVRGIRFCRALAAGDDAIDERSMVILLSLGGHDGEHDGRGAFERGIVEAAGPIPVVVAAGNDGERAVHAAGRVFGGEVARVGVQIPRSALEDASVGLTLKLTAFGREGAARLVAPGGARSDALDEAGPFSLAGASVRVEARDGAFGITISAEAGALPPGAWSLEITGSARFDVWLAGSRLGPTFFPAALGGLHVLRDESITIPATAPTLIAVGASVARPSVGGLGSVGVAGEVAAFSSRGPTPVGVPKPDIVAPGGWILARLSADRREGERDNLVGGRVDQIIDGRVAVRGSSAAAAVVAGALLLALELDPSRGPEARELLVSSTRESGWTADRGFGRLDLERLLARWSGEASDHLELTTPRALLDLADRGVWLSARGPGEQLVLSLGGLVFEAPMATGSTQVFVDPGRVSAGDVLRFEGAIDGIALEDVEARVVPDRRSPIGLGGGGCRVGHGDPGWAGWVLLGLFLGRRSERLSAAHRCGESSRRSPHAASGSVWAAGSRRGGRAARDARRGRCR